MRKSACLYTAAIVCLPWLAGAATARAGEPAKAAFSAQWQHAGETSAVVYWRTEDISKAAFSFVEYGETGEYGKKTPVSREARWAQFHRLTGLTPGKPCHYRMVNVDPQTKAETRSEDQALTPQPVSGAVRIPGEVQGPPYNLSKPGTKYVLTQDVKADGTAFLVSAANVTLDLDGHTVQFGDNFKNTKSEQANGVFVTADGPATVCNGHIVDSKTTGTYGAALQSRYRLQPMTVFGISTDVSQKCEYPFKFFGSCKDLDVHHNHIYSRVTEIESRHYPGNDLLRMDGIAGNVHVHDNLLTEGCHIGMRIGGPKDGKPEKVDIHHNDIRHHMQYVNGYALAVSCPGADVHHNRITSSGRCVHLTADGIQYRDNWADTKNHLDLDDMPQGSRPWRSIRVELHGIKFEGKEAKNCKVYNNFMRITQAPPVDSQGQGDPADKVFNGVYIRSKATALAADKLTDSAMAWEKDRWKGYWVKYDPKLPAVQIGGNDATSLSAKFEGQSAGEYTIYAKWDYVPATPLNIACYDANAMNEVWNNTIIALTTYPQTRIGGYGDSGQWAASVYFVGMKSGPAEAGKYSVYVHDNKFFSNHLFVSSGEPVNMSVRIEKNTFTLVNDPPAAEGRRAFRGIGPELENAIKAGGNAFEGMQP